MLNVDRRVIGLRNKLVAREQECCEEKFLHYRFGINLLLNLLHARIFKLSVLGSPVAFHLQATREFCHCHDHLGVSPFRTHGKYDAGHDRLGYFQRLYDHYQRDHF